MATKGWCKSAQNVISGGPESLFLLFRRGFLLISDLFVDPVHVLVGHGRVEWILNVVPWNGEAPHPRPAVDLLTIRAVTQWMFVIPIRFVVDHAPLVFVGHVTQPMIVVRERV